ncbi:MAG: imidazoleglycerol-phosphate dehydratase [Thermoleophilaceae bacterium]|nr:imidazoleglycerol-phosphate dehydratase [Thermoleophilaceae bacterium]
MSRTAEITRSTRETEIALSLELDGTGDGTRETGIGFLDHLLDAIARHGRLNLDVRVRGDLDTGPHHTVEDTGLVLGQALDQALADRAGIARFGEAVMPMDEARASAAIDISGRPLAVFEGPFPDRRVGDLEPGLAQEFLRAVASTAKLTLHVRVEAPGNDHHVIEAAFKAFALALRRAVAIDPTETGVPSTKGLL